VTDMAGRSTYHNLSGQIHAGHLENRCGDDAFSIFSWTADNPAEI